MWESRGFEEFLSDYCLPQACENLMHDFRELISPSAKTYEPEQPINR